MTRCEGDVYGDKDQEETRQCSAGDAREKAREKTHRREGAFGLEKTEFRRRKAEKKEKTFRI